MKLSNTVVLVIDLLKAMFRQHDWEDREVPLDGYTPPLRQLRCRKCGDTIPIDIKYINLGWWRGGCGGIKELLMKYWRETK